jgi:hypothetical protein
MGDMSKHPRRTVRLLEDAAQMREQPRPGISETLKKVLVSTTFT